MFGWIDSTKKTIDHQIFIQFFTRRKPRSNWSKVNKDKIEQLLKSGKMMQAGIDCVEIAQQNGSWSRSDAVEDLTIPEDLAAAFQAQPEAEAVYNGWSKSTRKSVLHWLLVAKRPETRIKRIREIMEHAAQNSKPIF